MTPEEAEKLIRENRERLEADRARQLHDREVQAMTQELDAPVSDVPEEELETKRYEAVTPAEVQEIP